MDQPNPRECPICNYTYKLNIDHQRVRSLGCGHSMCTSCLQRLHGRLSVICPLCRYVHQSMCVESIPINFGMEEFIRNSATSIIPAENFPILNAGMCDNHATVKLFYCETCEEYLCNHCTVIDHPRDENNHKIIDIQTLLNNKKLHNQTAIDSKLIKLQDVQNKITERLENLTRTKNTYTDIIEKFANIMSQIQGTMNEVDDLTIVETNNKIQVQQKMDEMNNVKNEVGIITTLQELTEVEQKVSNSLTDAVDLSRNEVSEVVSQFQIKSDAITEKANSALIAFAPTINPTNNPTIRNDGENGILITNKVLQEQVKAGSLFAMSTILGTLNKAELKLHRGKLHLPHFVPVVDWNPPSKAIILPYSSAKTASESNDFIVICNSKGYCTCHRKRMGDILRLAVKRHRVNPEVEEPIYY